MEITAKVIAHSVSSVGKHIITYELEYPRFIHSEFMTHRVFSRNAASSRAIPIQKMIEMVQDNPAEPVHWGKNQSGMQAAEELVDAPLWYSKKEWLGASRDATSRADSLRVLGAHKQIVNRLLEPFQMIKVVMTTTCLANFMWLRNHDDAQPEIRVLAEKMFEALKLSTPVELKQGDWHTPYFRSGYWKTDDNDGYSLDDALKISASCCAQVSYRKNDDSVEKARSVYARLVESEPVHASPLEHQATPLLDASQRGLTHFGTDNSLWSNNLKGWVQHRSLVANNVKHGLDYLHPYFV